MPLTLLIADSDSTLPADVSSLVRPAAEASVCGAVPYEPSSVSGEEREAAELYLQFLETHCHGTVRVDWKAELAKAEAALQKKPQSAFWHNQAGIAYEALGDFTNAIKELKLARALDPTDPGNDYALWALYKRRNDALARR
jgi:tetratricopeptide (TPR) repeat protein